MSEERKNRMDIQEISLKLTEVDERSKSNTHRLDKMEQRQDALDKLAESVARMDERQRRMDGDVKEIMSDVKAISQKSSKLFDGIVAKLIWLFIAAAVVALFARGGIAL